jgi:hypothetical protein
MENNLLINKLIRLHKEGLYDLYSSSNIFLIIKNNGMDGACSMYGAEDNLREGDHLAGLVVDGE